MCASINHRSTPTITTVGGSRMNVDRTNRRDGLLPAHSALLTGNFERGVSTSRLADFVLGQTVVGAGIAAFALLRDDMQKEERFVQQHSMSGGLNFLIIFVPGGEGKEEGITVRTEGRHHCTTSYHSMVGRGFPSALHSSFAGSCFFTIKLVGCSLILGGRSCCWPVYRQENRRK